MGYQILYAAIPQSEPSEMVPVVLYSRVQELEQQIAALKAEVKRLREAVALKEVASHTQRVCGRPSSSKDDKGFPTTTATSARSMKGPGRGFSGHY